MNYIISGYIGSGKDTAAEYMNGYIRLSFARPLKDICKLIRIGDLESAKNNLIYLFNNSPPADIDKKLIEFSKIPYDGIKDRQLLQDLGTNWARAHYPDIWANAVRKQIKPDRNYCIVDARFCNEFNAFPDFTSLFINCPDEIRKERLILRDGHYSKEAEKQGIKLTVTAILVKIVSMALKRFPQFNASVDMQNKQVIYKKYFNIGIAVDTEFGLMVPVLRNADRMNVIEIAREMKILAEKARTKKAGIADLSGGCFTITNLGGIGGTAFTPIVNAPEVAILGVSRGQMEPVYIDGKFEPRLMLPFSLSYDHRIIDGADGIRFLRWIIDAIENPMKLIVEG